MKNCEFQSENELSQIFAVIMAKSFFQGEVISKKICHGKGFSFTYLPARLSLQFISLRSEEWKLGFIIEMNNWNATSNRKFEAKLDGQS